MDEGLVYSCNMCNFKTIRKDVYMMHNVKHKEETVYIDNTCDPIINLDEVSHVHNAQNNRLDVV